MILRYSNSNTLHCIAIDMGSIAKSVHIHDVLKIRI